MRVFVTGGTGLIGSAVVAELLGNGHTVLALARSDASAQAAEAAGAEPLRGALADLDVLRAGAAQADGVIHLAFANDFSSPEALAQGGRRGKRRPRHAGRGAHRQRPSPRHRARVRRGCPAAPPPRPTRCRPTGRSAAAAARSPRSLGLAARGVRSTAVRLPRTVHNQGTGGFAGLLTNIARQTGVSGYPGDGTQRWPAVHALDAAVLFRLALEQADARHLLARRGRRGRRGARHRGGHRPAARACRSSRCRRRPTGPSARSSRPTSPSSSAHTRQALGWEPKHPSLLEDLENIQP